MGGQNPDSVSHATMMRMKHWGHMADKGVLGHDNVARKNRRKHRLYRLHQMKKYAHLNVIKNSTGDGGGEVEKSAPVSSSVTSKLKTKKTAVLFVPGIVAMYELVVNNVLYYLGQGWSLTVLSHRTADFYVRGTLKGLRNVQYIHLNESVQSRLDYDQKLTDPWFWSMFEPDEKVLLFDLDTLLLRKNVDDYMQYDFVSAPVTKCRKDRDINSLKAHIGSRKDGQSQYGPGAFSIRTAGVMFDIAARYRKTDIMETEASFFYRHAKEEGYNVASPEVMHSFAWGGEECESDWSYDLADSEFIFVPPPKKGHHHPPLPEVPLHLRRPLGLHAAWVYLSNVTLIDRLIDVWVVPKAL